MKIVTAWMKVVRLSNYADISLFLIFRHFTHMIFNGKINLINVSVIVK